MHLSQWHLGWRRLGVGRRIKVPGTCVLWVPGTFACGGVLGWVAPISGGVVRGMEMRERRIVPVGVIVGTFCESVDVSIGSFPTIDMIGRTVQFGIVRTSHTF